MPFLNFGGNKNKHFNLSDMNFFMKNMKNRYSDPDPRQNEMDPKRWFSYGSKVSRSFFKICLVLEYFNRAPCQGLQTKIPGRRGSRFIHTAFIIRRISLLG